MRTALTAFAAFAFGFTLMAADPFVGIWKLNLEKSKLRKDNNLVSQTMTISPIGPNAFRTAIDSVLKSGQKGHFEINRTYDGKEHLEDGVGVDPGASQICERIGDSMRKITFKMDGKVTGQMVSTISSDGKVMTNRTTTSKGEETTSVLDKQ
jgi:hypothetical protein